MLHLSVDARRVAIFAVVLIAVLCGPEIASACPFCSAVSLTLAERLGTASAAVVAVPKQIIPVSGGGSLSDPVLLELEVSEVLTGASSLRGKSFRVPYAARVMPYGPCLLTATASISAERLELADWSIPVLLSPESLAYLRRLPQLPATGPERLVRFLPYLNHPERLLSDDAYNEFAKAPLVEVATLRGKLDRDVVLKRLLDPSLPPHQRRLQWTLLSVCGEPADTAIFDQVLARRQPQAQFDPVLDASISAYLVLGGEPALERIERDYLANTKAEYTDVYAAIMAIRIHGEEYDRFTQARLAAALRQVLAQPMLADLVIPDLARWEDWTVVERLVELYDQATPETAFTKQPIIQYLQVCPLPAAQQALAALRERDPEVVQQAMSPFLVPRSLASSEPKATESSEPRMQQPVVASSPTPETAPTPETRAVTTAPSRRWLWSIPALGLCAFLVISFLRQLRQMLRYRQSSRAKPSSIRARKGSVRR